MLRFKFKIWRLIQNTRRIYSFLFHQRFLTISQLMVLLIFLFNLFFYEKFILLNFLSKIKHCVFIIVFLVQNFVVQWHKWFLSFSHILTCMSFSLEFLTFFRIPFGDIPFKLILFKWRLTVFVIRLVVLFRFFLKSR